MPEGLKFGKQPALHKAKDFHFADVIAGIDLPPAPNRFGHGTLYGDWFMLGNDLYGDCVFAGFAHQAMVTTKLDNPAHPAKFTTTDVLKDYSAVTGFDPANPDTDQGTIVSEGLAYWRNEGIHKSSGRHKIGAYISIDPKNWDELMQAAYIFSGVGIGWNVPETIWDQWDHGTPFDVVDEGASIIGGH